MAQVEIAILPISKEARIEIDFGSEVRSLTVQEAMSLAAQLTQKIATLNLIFKQDWVQTWQKLDEQKG